MRVTGISIYKNPTGRWGNLITSQFEQYRVTDKDELKKTNEIWTQILENRKKKIIAKT